MSAKTRVDIPDGDTHVVVDTDPGSLDTIHADPDDPASSGSSASRAVDATPEPLRGDTIGRFVLLGVLGAGGMGVVYSAYDPQLDRRVAIKLLRASSRDGVSDAVTRMLREAQAMAKINHPNVIKVHDVGTYREQVYVAMEYADGGTLRAWLDGGRRPTREVLDVFVQAGRGLAAAHAAGLVHRDFKPDNVLMGSDGGVRVTDFGLVGLAGAPAPVPPPDHETAVAVGEPTHATTAVSISRDTPLTQDLTRTGAIMGTPLYMAPEQFNSGTTTDRVDQFAFCVALYEALYGTRPFAGTSMLELSAQVLLGEIAPPPPGARVSGWLRRVVMRGLAVDPARRYPSMTALLVALTRDPRRRWWQVTAAIAMAALAVTGVALARATPEPAACRGGGDRVDRVWGPSRQAALAKAFEASGRPHAAATYGRLASMLDDWSARWQDGYVDACEATHVRAEQSDHLLDLRMQCLTRRLDDASATIDLLAAGGGDAVDHALDAVRALPSLDACADAAALTASVAPPADAATTSRVAAVRARLDDARGLDRLGRYAAALAAARPALAEARTIGYAPVVAEALLVIGRIEAALVDHAAFADLREATRIAIKAGDDATMIAASTALVSVLTRHSGQFDVARELVELADATADRIQLRGAPRIELDNAYSRLDLKQGRNAEAQARYTATLAVAERDLAPDAPGVFATLDGLGVVANALGHFDDAAKLDERVVAMTEQVYGKDHPDVANALNNLGIAYRNADRLDDAKRVLDRALAIRIAALGPDHPEVGDSLNSLGTFYLDQGDAASAEPYFSRALALWQKAYGDDNIEVTPALANLAIVYQGRGDLAKARSLLERTLALDEASYGSDDPRVASMLSNLGGVASDQHRYDDALALYQRAERIAEAAYGPDHPDVADYLSNIATAYKRLGKIDDAVAAHERALRAMEKAYGPDHTRVAMALANLGNLQSDRNDYAGALVSYQRSLAIFEAKLKKDHPYVSYSLLGIGGALIELKRRREAVPYLERALAIRVAAKMPPELVAEARYALARALDRGPRAVAAATTALAEYKTAGNAESVGVVKQWLAEHR